MHRKALPGALLLAISIGCAGVSPAGERALTGGWGGPHIRLELTGEGGTVEYDCAHGTIDGPVVPDGAGLFEAAGTHTAERGGPVREGEEERGRPARYRGKVSGNTMKLSVSLMDSGEELGAFALSRGAAPRLTKCL